MTRYLVPFLAAFLLAAAPAKPPRVEIRTDIGSIVVAVDTRHAPVTAANFLAYVDQKRFDDMNFYRAARADGRPKEGFVQGGTNNMMTRVLKPIKHEPTSVTGIHHVDGTLSMARDDPGTATGDFFIVVGDGRYLDATRKDPGYAAFGHVLSGMPLVRQMLAAKTYPGGWSKETAGQQMVKPVRIISARRLP
ncbi:peptidylprolyl isomerase [Nostoc sp. 3335mG]|nr:peptidylprolyl isomerase [Nostoc sp. 3335mG]